MAQDHDAGRLTPPLVSAVPGTTAGLWRLNPRHITSWREWDGEVVVYDESTASTHRLDPSASAVFLTLHESGAALSEGTLLACLAPEGTFPADSAAGMSSDGEHLRDILDSLQRCGLAECRAS